MGKALSGELSCTRTGLVYATRYVSFATNSSLGCNYVLRAKMLIFDTAPGVFSNSSGINSFLFISAYVTYVLTPH